MKYVNVNFYTSSSALRISQRLTRYQSVVAEAYIPKNNDNFKINRGTCCKTLKKLILE